MKERPVEIADGPATLPGDITVPDEAQGIVLFAHGSGSGRNSPRNLQVAGALHRRSLATLLFDLLTPDEANDRERVFDIPLLARRLRAALTTTRGQQDVAELPVGLFGASTGAAAALWAAADEPERVQTVVSRGGRPDLAQGRLETVSAPTLLIVGGNDDVVLDLNRGALERLTCTKQLEVIPGATHLFEEPGALERVADLAGDWFARHLAK